MQLQSISATEGSHGSEEFTKPYPSFGLKTGFSAEIIFHANCLIWMRKVKNKTPYCCIQIKNPTRHIEKLQILFQLLGEYFAPKLSISVKGRKTIFPTVLISCSLLSCPSEGMSKDQTDFPFQVSLSLWTFNFTTSLYKSQITTWNQNMDSFLWNLMTVFKTKT